MAHRDIVVIGASMGGLEALTRLVGGFPRDLPASVLVVQHMAASGRSYLAGLLDAAGPLHAAPARDEEALEHGRIYVAVPDRHLMIDKGRIRLSRGPKESHSRPSVDVLFRSAAYSFGRRVIGVVLTGQLDDGTAGLWAIKDRGGIAIVQSPEEARYPSMPTSARRNVAVDYCLRLSDMPERLASLAREPVSDGEDIVNDKFEIETQIALDEKALPRGVLSIGKPSFYTCPDCNGSMVLIEEGPIKRFRCHTGHGFTEQAFLQQSATRIEAGLFEALAKLEERQVLLRDLVRRGNDAERSQDYGAEIAEIERMAQRLRELTRTSVFMHRMDVDGEREAEDTGSRSTS